jgi:hypothetical protein
MWFDAAAPPDMVMVAMSIMTNAVTSNCRAFAAANPAAALTPMKAVMPGFVSSRQARAVLESTSECDNRRGPASTGECDMSILIDQVNE